jgi:hypothetical protein
MLAPPDPEMERGAVCSGTPESQSHLSKQNLSKPLPRLQVSRNVRSHFRLSVGPAVAGERHGIGELIRTEPCTALESEYAFEVRTPTQARKFEPNRRCQKNKRPGVRVKARGTA